MLRIASGLGAAVVFTGLCFAQSNLLSYRPVAAEYSKTLDRLIMVSATPPQLHIYDPAAQSDVVILLPKAPNAVSVSPDGLHAAVGHDALVTFVNLQSATVEQVLPVNLNVTALSLSSAYAYLIDGRPLQNSTGVGTISWMNLSTGAVSNDTGEYAAAFTRLTPSGKVLYGTYGQTGLLVKFDVSTGPITGVTVPQQQGVSQGCGNIAYSEDGARLYTACGPVLRLSDDPAVEPTYLTSLTTAPEREGEAESAALKRLAVIPSAVQFHAITYSDTQIQLYETDYFEPRGILMLSRISVAGKTLGAHGKWLFFNRAGTTLFVLAEGDSSAGIQNDFAVQTFALASPPACVAAFGPGAARAVSTGEIGSASIAATPDCLYQASTAAPWIKLLSGDFGLGPGTLRYLVQPNPGYSVRTGSIALGNQVLTVTQDAAVLPTPFSRLAYHIVDAAYSRALDRLVFVSSPPNELHIYDAITQSDRSIALSSVPLALSISPDGLYAAVAHDGWITYVNLQTAAVDRVLQTFNPLSALQLAGNGYVYAPLPNSAGGIFYLQLATGNTGTLPYNPGQALRLRPAAKQLIAFEGAGPATFDISQGPPVLLPAPVSVSTFLQICGNAWFSENGQRAYTGCGKAYQLSNDLPALFTYTNSVLNAETFTWVDDSSIQGAVAAILGPASANSNLGSDTEVAVLDDRTLGTEAGLTLPQFSLPAGNFAGHGKFVFWNSAATKVIALEQADSSANLTSDYGVYVTPSAGASIDCRLSFLAAGAGYPVTGGAYQFYVSVNPGCAWTAQSNVNWIAINAGSFELGGSSVSFSIAPNTGAARTGTITVGGQTFLAAQAGVGGSVAVSPDAITLAEGTNTAYITVTASGPAYAWTAQSSAPWLTITSGASGTGNGRVDFKVQLNPTPYARNAAVSIGGSVVQVTQRAATPQAGLHFTPITPCRVVDTRTGSGKTGVFGAPVLAANTSRDFPLPAGGCGLQSSAQAYALNVTVIPDEPLSYLTLWPTDQAQPFVSTLNSFDGRIVANAAIVPAGTSGAVSVYVTNRANVIIDATGYFDTQSAQGLSFYASTPCRVADTRGNPGPFGGPSLPAGSSRDFPLPGAGCGIPQLAQAYSTNITVVPSGPLYFLTSWPTGQAKPLVSTLNSYDGSIVANAAIVPAGINGSVSLGVTNKADVILDSNGYFAPPGAPNGLRFYPLPPCRVADTRTQASLMGPFGPPSIAANSSRDFPLATTCGIPAGAQAYSLNVTVVPTGPLAFLSLWPTGQARPQVSTLNSFGGKIVSNAAIVPGGTNGSISLYASDATDVILDVNGYFAP